MPSCRSWSERPVGALPAGSPCKQDSCDHIWLIGAARSQDCGQALPRPTALLSGKAEDGGASAARLCIWTRGL